MITDIKWAQFILCIVVFTAVYYTIILFIIYKHSIGKFIKEVRKGKRTLYFKQTGFDAHAYNSNESVNTFSDGYTQILYDLRQTLKQASIKSFSVEEIIFSLQITLDEYGSLISFQKRIELTEFIKTECKNLCSIHLEDERLNQLWIR